jgi:hypothetical protein
LRQRSKSDDAFGGVVGKGPEGGLGTAGPPKLLFSGSATTLFNKKIEKFGYVG